MVIEYLNVDLVTMPLPYSTDFNNKELWNKPRRRIEGISRARRRFGIFSSESVEKGAEVLISHDQESNQTILSLLDDWFVSGKEKCMADLTRHALHDMESADSAERHLGVLHGMQDEDSTISSTN
jgi:hypothetical protein